MTDSLGWRMLFGVVAPSTNTSVQPEYDDMRPFGVTNHFSRIAIPDTAVHDDASFMEMLENIRANTLAAIDPLVGMRPDCVVVGMSAETFWDGPEGAAALEKRIVEQARGAPVILGSTAICTALAAYGGIRRIGVITPYTPVADRQVRRFFEESGYEVVHLLGLKSPSPRLIAHESAVTLKRATVAVSEDVDAVVQCGTNLAFARVAAMAEIWLEKPVIAINTATYWHALRTMGLRDRRDGFGTLLRDH